MIDDQHRSGVTSEEIIARIGMSLPRTKMGSGKIGFYYRSTLFVLPIFSLGFTIVTLLEVSIIFYHHPSTEKKEDTSGQMGGAVLCVEEEKIYLSSP